MKNTKLHIRKLAKAGFSLVEMLVVDRRHRRYRSYRDP